uniref:TOG domain-containing protein n=1 Tax=Parastrongyloides trichosuri TaxID=131310 RepID=A0A0N4ZY29_PARTI
MSAKSFSRVPSSTRVISVTAKNTGSAGACTLDDFEKNFTSVPNVMISSNHELVSFFNNTISIGLNAADVDWEKRVLALRQLRSLIQNDSYNLDAFYDEILPNLEIPLQKAIKDLRSQVVREAAYTIALYGQTLGNKMDKIAEALFPDIISVVQSSAKVMASAANILCTFLAKNICSHKFLLRVLQSLNHKSREIRRCVYLMIETIIESWTDSNITRSVNSISDAIYKAINDADPDVRTIGRKCFNAWEERYPEEAGKIFKMLDPSKQKAINGTLASSSSSRSITDAVRSKPSTASSIKSSAYSRATSEIDTTSARRAMGSSRYGSVNRPPILAKPISSTTRNGGATPSTRKPLYATQSTSSTMTNGRPSMSQPGSRSGSPNRLAKNLGRMRVAETPKLYSVRSNRVSAKSTKPSSPVAFELNNEIQMESAALTDAINKCNQLSDKREHLNVVFHIMETGRTLDNTDVDKIFNCLWKIYKESQSRQSSEMLNAIELLFSKYNQQVTHHLTEIYPRILLKMSNDSQPASKSVHIKLLNHVKKVFAPKDRFVAIATYIQNPLNSPPVKTKQLLLKEYGEVLRELNSKILRETSEFVPSFIKILQILESSKNDQFTSDVEIICKAIFDLDASTLSEIVQNKLTNQQRTRVLEFINGGDKVSMSPLRARHDNVIPQQSSSKFYGNSCSNYNNGRERSFDHTPPSNSSSSTLDVETSKFFYSNSQEFKRDVDEQKRVIDAIQLVLMPDTVSPHKAVAAKALETLIKDKCFTLWDEHFGSTLMLLIKNLSDDDDLIVANNIGALREMIVKEHIRLDNYYAFLIKSFVQVKQRGETINKLLDGCSNAMAKYIPAKMLISTLIPLLEVDDHHILTNVLKLLGKVFEYVPKNEGILFLPECCPAVTKFVSHPESIVRRSTIICIVAIINKCTRKEVDGYLSDFDRAQTRLLDVYLSRANNK